MDSLTYLTTDELSNRIKYDPRTIRNRLKDSVLLEGIHYIRRFCQVNLRPWAGATQTGLK
jgi:hypothetical protein